MQGEFGMTRKHFGEQVVARLAFAVLVMLMFGQSASADLRQQVGVLAASVGQVQLRDSTTGDAPVRTIAPGAPVHLYDEIITGANTKAQILMMDETTFSVGANTALVIDEFIFNPADHGDGQITANITKGVFRFISGRIAKANSANMKVKAGNAVISVRGTEVIGTIAPDASTIVLLSGQIDMTSTSAVCQAGGTGCDQQLTRPGFGVEVTATGQFTSPTRFAADDINAVISSLDLRSTGEDEAGEDGSEEDGSEEDSSEEDGSEEGGSDDDEAEAAPEEEADEPAEEEADAKPEDQQSADQQAEAAEGDDRASDERAGDDDPAGGDPVEAEIIVSEDGKDENGNTVIALLPPSRDDEGRDDDARNNDARNNDNDKDLGTAIPATTLRVTSAGDDEDKVEFVFDSSNDALSLGDETSAEESGGASTSGATPVANVTTSPATTISFGQDGQILENGSLDNKPLDNKPELTRGGTDRKVMSDFDLIVMRALGIPLEDPDKVTATPDQSMSLPQQIETTSGDEEKTIADAKEDQKELAEETYEEEVEDAVDNLNDDQG
ncbi:MAG: FecR domain-containing protein, partial [Alphaproteobacteria bacterium]|nr:FecR domain-containing protein [Alphaproteobacteria bacterium]